MSAQAARVESAESAETGKRRTCGAHLLDVMPRTSPAKQEQQPERALRAAEDDDEVSATESFNGSDEERDAEEKEVVMQSPPHVLPLQRSRKGTGPPSSRRRRVNDPLPSTVSCTPRAPTIQHPPLFALAVQVLALRKNLQGISNASIRRLARRIFT